MRIYADFNYKELQTIKHSLQISIESKEGTDKESDVPYDRKLLDRVTGLANSMKEEYGIERKES